MSFYLCEIEKEWKHGNKKEEKYNWSPTKEIVYTAIATSILRLFVKQKKSNRVQICQPIVRFLNTPKESQERRIQIVFWYKGH